MDLFPVHQINQLENVFYHILTVKIKRHAEQFQTNHFKLICLSKMLLLQYVHSIWLFWEHSWFVWKDEFEYL